MIYIKIYKQDVVEILKKARNKSEYLNEIKPHIDSCEKSIEIISSVLAASDSIAKVHDFLGDSNLFLICEALASMKNSLSALPADQTELGSGRVCTYLRREGKVLQNRLNTRLRRLLSACIVTESGRISVRKKLKGMIKGEDKLIEDPILLADIFESLKKCGIIDSSIDDVLSRVWALVISPLWREKKYCPAIVNLSADYSELYFDTIIKSDAASVADYKGEIP